VIHKEPLLSTDFGIKNGGQDCKIGTVVGGVLVGGRRVNGGDEGEGTWLMGFLCTRNRTMKPFAIVLSEKGKGLRREMVGVI
jgi:hypothetical protein